MVEKIIKSPFFYILTGIYIIAGYHVLTFGNQAGAFFLSEDHYFENVGAITFFLASLIYFYGFWKLRLIKSTDKLFVLKKLAFLGLAFLFFFAAGEEISWGQRIFHIQTPESLSQVNNQDEITVHNIPIAIAGHEIAFETMFDMLWLFLTVIVPFSSMYRPARQIINRLLPISHWGVGVLFFLNYLWAKAAKLLYVDKYVFNLVSLPFVQAVQEVKESNYSLLFAFAALFSVFNLLYSELDIHQ